MRVALLSLVSMVGGVAVPVAAQAMMQSYHLNALTIAPETVKSHVKRIFFKLEVKNRAQAVSRAGAQGQIRTGGSWLQIS